jgi:hypothetical protein
VSTYAQVQIMFYWDFCHYRGSANLKIMKRK